MGLLVAPDGSTQPCMFYTQNKNTVSGTCEVKTPLYSEDDREWYCIQHFSERVKLQIADHSKYLKEAEANLKQLQEYVKLHPELALET